MDTRTGVYGLGATFYRALSGQRDNPDERPSGIYAHAHGRTRPVEGG